MKSDKQNPGGSGNSILYDKIGLKPDQRILAVWGFPEPDVFEAKRKLFADHLLLDLDVPYGAPESKLLPDNYCQIITNIIDNALALRDKIDLVIASVGEEKCDQGRFAAYVLENLGFNVLKTRYTSCKHTTLVPAISESSLPLKEKVLLIMDSLLNPAIINNSILKKSIPEYGFWGVPPNDLTILELFPDATHVYGWTRCVELKRPADLELEMYVDEGIPTVFFAQTFCAKMQLAKYLAQKYDGLYVDADDYMSVSVRAKIEAFLRLS